jgi:hypothetical protein
MIKQPSEESHDLVVVIGKVLPLVYQYFHFLVTQTKYYTNEKLFDKALCLYKLVRLRIMILEDPELPMQA